MYKIGVVGNGFVGNAVVQGFSDKFNYKAEIRFYDKDKSKSQDSLYNTVNKSDFVFVSVPTPSFKSGEIDLSILDGALSEINNINTQNNIVLIRSTVIPGTSEKFQKKYKKLNIVFNPEFLTERNALHDFAFQKRTILSGQKEDVQKVKKLYIDRFGQNHNIFITNYQTAELIKYMNNLFLATKVSFMNEMKVLADSIDVNWEDAVNGFILDERVGKSHNNVPGPDGMYGFGGSCFPKDIQALLFFAKQMKIDMKVVKGAWDTNLKIRKNKDWEKLKNRAVSE
jgi:UDPglucose 6-dehydrogenase